MNATLLIVQILNGLQFGVLLFLIAAGLTLVFGVMNFINLAHGVQYMIGAYLAVTFYALTGNFLLATVFSCWQRSRSACCSNLRCSGGSTSAIISTRSSRRSG
jgi:branched-subunit amino acid ABC-type transport system permease component